MGDIEYREKGYAELLKNPEFKRKIGASLTAEDQEILAKLEEEKAAAEEERKQKEFDDRLAQELARLTQQNANPNLITKPTAAPVEVPRIELVADTEVVRQTHNPAASATSAASAGPRTANEDLDYLARDPDFNLEALMMKIDSKQRPAAIETSLEKLDDFISHAKALKDKESVKERGKQTENLMMIIDKKRGAEEESTTVDPKKQKK